MIVVVYWDLMNWLGGTVKAVGTNSWPHWMLELLDQWVCNFVMMIQSLERPEHLLD